MTQQQIGQRYGVHTVDDATVLVFPYAANPLPANGQRGSWRAHAGRVRAVRTTSAQLASTTRLRALPAIEVSLTWFVTVNRRRDADNLVPVMKAMVDGLTSAGVITDDNDDIVTRQMPRIVPAPAGSPTGWMELTIRPLGAAA